MTEEVSAHAAAAAPGTGTPGAAPAGNKNIIICSDGTGNTVNKGRGTNVFKLFEAVDHGGHVQDPTLTRQIAIYDDGVGSKGFRILRAIAGGVGLGLARNVRQLYRELSRVYEPGDRIYMFGFSRGAFTVRTLASLVDGCGVINMESGHRPPLLRFLTPGTDLWLQWVSWRAWRMHRWNYRAVLETVLCSWYKGSNPSVGLDNFRAKYSRGGTDLSVPNIHFVGVWDTVGAVAVPSNGLRVFLNNFIYRFSFPNKTLPGNVEKACHAIAIDEERHAFWPVLWDEKLVTEGEGEEARTVAEKVGDCQCGFESPASRRQDAPDVPGARAVEPRIEQVWFPGVHSNIGGGYPKQGVSHVSLDWMMAMAERSGLRFGALRDQFHRQRNIHDQVYDSRRGAALYYTYWPRDIEALTRKGSSKPKREDYPPKILGWPFWKVADLRYNQKTAAVLRVHASTFDRIEARTDGYAPGMIPDSLIVVDTPGEERSGLEEMRRRVARGTPQRQSPWIYLRWVVQAILYAATGVAVWYVLQAESKGLLDAIWENYSAPTTLIREMWKEDKWFLVVVVAALISLFILSRGARAKIRAQRSTYWREIFGLKRQGSGS